MIFIQRTIEGEIGMGSGRDAGMGDDLERKEGRSRRRSRTSRKDPIFGWLLNYYRFFMALFFFLFNI